LSFYLVYVAEDSLVKVEFVLVFVIVIGGHGDAGSSFELLTAELHEHLGGGRYSGALSRSSSLSWPVYRLSSEGNCRVNQ
jgi:hypothetical protein